ncbi:hypothetical protein QFC24_007131, partial [Naganishia onofrii]
MSDSDLSDVESSRGATPLRAVTAAETTSSVDLLDQATALIRAKVVQTLQARNVTAEQLVAVMKGHDKNDVVRTVPMVLSSLVTSVSKQTTMRVAMRKALQLLQAQHDFDFSGFNDVYKLFLEGREPEKRSSIAIEVCNRFFKDNQPFKGYLQLKTEGSNLKHLKVICDCAERLNLTPEKIQGYAFRIRDLRVAGKPGTQGVSQLVTGDDLDQLKAELQRCEANLSSKRKKDLDIEDNLRLSLGSADTKKNKAADKKKNKGEDTSANQKEDES